MCGRSRLPALRRYLRPLRGGPGPWFRKRPPRGQEQPFAKRALVRISAETARCRERDWAPLARWCIVNPSKAVILAQAHRPSSAPGRRSFVRGELAAPPLLPLANRPLLEHALDWLDAGGLREVAVLAPDGLSAQTQPRGGEGRLGLRAHLARAQRPAPAWAPRWRRSATSSATSRSCSTWPTACPARASTR